MSTAAATTPTPYDGAFYADQADGSLRSARVIAPIVFDLVGPASVLDVGCGVGTWLRAFAELGVNDYLGIDGDYVDRGKLLIAADRFRAIDLLHPAPLNREFDLAVCLEVAEHLPERAAEGLIELLVSAAPAVLFSAAVPGQGGTSHVNERWPDYWRGLFEAQGFVRLDPVRPRVWRDSRVEWWYQQNAYVFIRQSLLADRPNLKSEFELAQAYPFELLHRGILGPCLRATTLRGMVAASPGIVWRALRRLFR